MSEKFESEQNDESEAISQRGIYLLPNLLTTAALFAGFYAVVAAMKGLFDTAAIAVFAAMLADGLDGRVARLTNTQSAFGAQYDSLSDLVAFGVAPALVLYSWSLSSLGKLGWIIAFIYVAATALRLARFNVQVSEKTNFQGIPSTLAAGFVAGMVWMFSGYDIPGQIIAIPVAVVTVLMAALMVSSIRYTSSKSIDFKGRVPFVTAVIVVFVIAAVALRPAEVLFAVFAIYAASGPVMTLWQVRKARRQRKMELKARRPS
jgi:CDP-diacylglycerol--serine O-phosphatidyltransferase